MPTSKQPMMHFISTDASNVMQPNGLTKEDLNMEIAREMMLCQVKNEHDAVPIRVNVARLKAALEGEFYTMPQGLTREQMRAHILAAGKD